MEHLVAITIFIIVVLLYFHINYHLTVTRSRTVYYLDKFNKKELNTFCYYKQPLIGEYKVRVPDTLDKLTVIDKKHQTKIDLDEKNSNKLLSKKNYYSETCCYNIDKFRVYDAIFSPLNVVRSDYHLIKNNIATSTLLQCELAYRTFFAVMSGSVTVKLIPPTSIESTLDDDNLSYYTNTSEITDYIEKPVRAGEVIFIPSYWWYKLELQESTTVARFKYFTALNMVSIFPVLCKIGISKLYVDKNINKIS